MLQTLKSIGPIGSWRLSIIQTSTMSREPKKNSKKLMKPMKYCMISRNGLNMISLAPLALKAALVAVKASAASVRAVSVKVALAILAISSAICSVAAVLVATPRHLVRDAICSTT